MVDEARGSGGTLFIWLEGEPGVMPADVTIPDEPGINDNDQIADAIRRGDLGRYLPVTIKFADLPNPSQKRVRSLDTARLLRDRHIRHRRRYEVMDPSPQPPPRGYPAQRGEGESGSE
jgi:hypothetical protein